MRVERRSLLAGAAEASGIAVVIDVLRAFTCSALMFHYGIRELLLVRTAEEALAFRAADAGCLVAGEVKGRRPEGFDLGNSPAEIMSLGEPFFRDRRVAARSSAGTQGVLAAGASAERIVLGSFATAAATAQYIRRVAQPDTIVTLVAMGYEGRERSVEDERCADYLEYLLGAGGGARAASAGEYDHLSTLRDCLRDPSIADSVRGVHDYRSPEDIVLSFQRDLFDFVMVGMPEERHVRVVRSR